jgi:hypothetical protein
LQPAIGPAVDLFDNWFDPIETEVRARSRQFVARQSGQWRMHTRLTSEIRFEMAWCRENAQPHNDQHSRLAYPIAPTSKVGHPQRHASARTAPL